MVMNFAMREAWTSTVFGWLAKALLTASELLGGDGPFWRLPAWAVRVTDDVGKDVFTVKVTIGSP